MTENFDLSKDGRKIPVKDFAFNEANNYREKNDFGVFNNYLEMLFDTIVNTIKPDSEKKAKLISEYEDKIKQKDAEKSNLLVEKSKLSNDISRLSNTIEASKSELELLNKGQMKRPYIELTFLIFAMLILTIFIWIYYSSSLYGINTDSKSSKDILAVSLNSFSFLINELSTTSIFYLCMPIIFFVMGYVVHNQREQNRKKKFVFILITLIIDFIIGYILTMKNYNNNRSFEDPVFSFEMLFSGMGLYFVLFIFLGFGAYIMWGYLFETITQIWEKSTVSNAILNLRNRINDLNTEINTLELSIEQLNIRIEEIQKKIIEFSEVITNIKNDKIIFSKTKFDGSIAISISEWLRSTHYFEPNRNQQSDNLAIRNVAETWKESKYKTNPSNIIFID
jgi:chaperonin cofactor prefoldin